jgi:hypothetical protein
MGEVNSKIMLILGRSFFIRELDRNDFRTCVLGILQVEFFFNNCKNCKSLQFYDKKNHYSNLMFSCWPVHDYKRSKFGLRRCCK